MANPLFQVPYWGGNKKKTKNVADKALVNQANEIIGRSDALSSWNSLNPNVVSREEARIVAMSGVLDRGPFAMPEPLYKPKPEADTRSQVSKMDIAMQQAFGPFGGMAPTGSAALRTLELANRPFQVLGALESVTPKWSGVRVGPDWQTEIDDASRNEAADAVRRATRELLRGNITDWQWATKARSYLGELVDIQEQRPLSEQMRSEGLFMAIPVERALRPLLKMGGKATGELVTIAKELKSKYSRSKQMLDKVDQPTARPEMDTPELEAWYKRYGFTGEGDDSVRTPSGGIKHTLRAAGEVAGQPQWLKDPLQIEAIRNTEGAEITAEGILLKAARYQKPEQAGMFSIRSGVFYLPEVKSPYQRYYSTGKVGYGGKQKIERTIEVKNPIILKGASGGKVPERAYDMVMGKKGSYQAMRDDVLKATSRLSGASQDDILNAVADVLAKYGGDEGMASEIIRFSKEGNQLPYAVQENIVANVVRNAGYDAILGYNKVGGKNRLSEVFALSETHYPDPMDVMQAIDPALARQADEKVVRISMGGGDQARVQSQNQEALSKVNDALAKKGRYRIEADTDAMGQEGWLLYDADIPNSPPVAFVRLKVRLEQSGMAPDSLAAQYGDSIIFDSINVNPTLRNQGVGSNFMKSLTGVADDMNLSIRGTGAGPGEQHVPMGALQRGEWGADEVPDIFRQLDEEALKEARRIEDVAKTNPKEAFRINATIKETEAAIEFGAKRLEEALQNVNLKMVPDHLQPLVIEAFLKNPEKFFNEAKRGTKTFEEIAEGGAGLFRQHFGIDIEKAISRWKPGVTLNSEEQAALWVAIDQSLEEQYTIQRMLSGAEELSTNKSVTELQAELSLISDRVASLLYMDQGASAEIARTLSARRMKYSQIFDTLGEPGRDRLTAQRLVERLAVRGEEQFKLLTKRLAEWQRNNPDKKMASILEDPKWLLGVNRELHKAHLWDYLMELRYSWMLTNPSTQIVNLVGNAAQIPLAITEKTLAVPIEMGISRFQGRIPERYWTDIPAALSGGWEGFLKGVHIALDTLRHGMSVTDVSKIELRRTAFGGSVGRFVRAGLDLLQAADLLMGQIHFQSHLHTLINRMIQKEIRKGTVKGSEAIEALKLRLHDDPPKWMLQEAEQEALYRTFRNEPPSWAQTALEFRGRGNAGKLFQLFVPFIRTPSNLLEYGLIRSPVGLSRFLQFKHWRKASSESGQLADELSATTIGTMISLAMGVYASNGNITGPVPIDARERALFYEQGKKAYSFRIGDWWIPYDRFEPFNAPLAQTAIVIDAINNNEPDEDVTNQILKLIKMFTDGAVSRQWMGNAQQLLDASLNPDQFAGRSAASIARMFIPYGGILRQVAQVLDPTIRRPVEDQGFLTEVGTSIARDIPGLTRFAVPRVGLFGETADRPAINVGGINVAPFLPVKASPAANSKVLDEMERLKVFPPTRATRINGKPVSEEWLIAHQLLAGGVMKHQIDQVMAQPEWNDLPDIERIGWMEKYINDARTIAADAVEGLIIQKVDGKELLKILQDDPSWAQGLIPR